MRTWTQRARRGWGPIDLGAILTLSPLTMGSGTLTTWSDIYGKSTSVTQATSGKRPTVNLNSRGTGRHGLLFDGSDDFLQGTFTLNQPCTIGIFYKSLVVGNLVANDIIFDGGNNLSALVSAADLPNVVVNFAVSASTSVASPTANGVYERWIIVANGASSSVYKNGTNVFSGQIGTNNTGGLTIAALRNGTRCTNIEVGAVSAFSSALNAADVARLDAWLSAA